MPIDLFAPTASFESPLELLLACHEHIRRFSLLLNKLGAHLVANGRDVQAQEAARSIVRYFDIAAPLHHQDEDEDVFPALRQKADVALRHTLDTLALEHQQLEKQWQQLRPALIQIANGHNEDWPAALAEAFAAQYCAHVQREEADIYPYASALLDENTLLNLSERMALRRHD